MALQDLLQGAENAIGNAVQGAGNFVNNDIIHPVEQVFQPQPIQSPIPQNHPMFQAPPIQNFTDWMGQQAQNAENAAGNAIQSGVQAVGNYFNPNNVGSAGNPTPNFWTTPVAQGLGQVQQVGAQDIKDFAQGFTTPATNEDFNRFNANGGVNPYNIGNFLGNDILGGSGKLIAEAPAEGQAAFNITKAAIGGVLGAGTTFTANYLAGKNTQPQDLIIPTIAGVALGGAGGGTDPALDIFKADPVDVAKQTAQDINEGDSNLLNHEAIAPYKKALSIAGDPNTQAQLVNAISDVKTNGMIGDETANNILTSISQKLLPQGLTDRLNTVQLADTWEYLLSRVNGVVPESVPSWMGKFDNAVFDISGRKTMQAGFIKPSAFIPGGDASETPPEAGPEAINPQQPSVGGTTTDYGSQIAPIGYKPTAPSMGSLGGKLLNDPLLSPTMGYIQNSKQVGSLIDKYGDFSLIVKDVNGQRARMNASDFLNQMQNPAFKQRVRDVFVNKDASPVTKVNAHEGFMEALQNKDVAPLQASNAPHLGQSADISGIKLENNSSISRSQQVKFVNAITDNRIREPLKQLGITKLSIEPPNKFGLSEQANIDIKNKEIHVNADATDPTQTILHELGHAKFAMLPEQEQARLLDIISKSNEPSIQGYLKTGNYKEAVADTLLNKPEIYTSPSLKEQLTQPPLPPKMSSKAITEGLEAPQTGRDVSVSPQAAIRYRIAKNAGVKMTMENPEPLPWENGSEPTPLSDEWINQRALPTTPADAGLPPKEDQPVVKISNKEDPVKITNPNGTVRDARAEMDTAKTQIQARGRVVQQLVKDAIDKAGVPEEGGNATNTGANKLFRVAIEHPENEPDILTQVKNPVQFKQALDQFREFTGFNLKAAQDAGAKLKGLKGYYSHIWDLSDPEKAAEFQQLSKASAQNYKGWYNKPRVFKDIAEGESYGFRLKNKNVANDVAEYTNAFAKEQGARVLSNRLVSDFPDKAVILNQGDPTPIDMKQSDIPGAKGLFTSQDIKDQLKDLEPHEKTGLGVKIISNINNIDKQVRLGGGLFHIQNTGLDYLASQVGLGRFPRLITAARTFLDPAFYANYMRGAINDGTIDKMAKANVSLDTEQDFSGKQTGVSKLSKNPLTALNDATFKRLENFFKTEAFRALDNKGLIDTSTPQGVKVAQQYGREINNMFGGQNRVVGDDIFKSSVGRFTSHFGLLAPDYQQGRFKHTFSALGIGNGGGFNPLNRTAGNNYAAYTLALRVAITAMAAEGLRRALTGKFNPNLISVVKNDLLDPNFPTPWQNTSTNGTKENEIAHMPASNLSDWYRAINDPQQFAISHLGAGLSDATAFISNKDYFGNTISQTNNPVEKLFKIGLNDAPIPVVQAGKVISGRVPIGNAIINELGDRVSLDPNDPMALFYAGQKQAMNNLLSKTPDPKMQNALTSGLTQLQSVGALNPNDPRRKQVEYTVYAAFPQLFQVQQQASLAQAGGDPSKADPLFTSPYANEYIEYEQVSSSAPGSSEEKDYLNQHPELIPLIQARAAFYQAHPIAQNPNAPAYIPAPQPNSYVQQQLAAKNYNDPQVQAYLTAHGQYVNNQRQAIGLPMLNSFGQNPMEAAKSNASYQRNQMYSLSRKLKYINKESAYQTKKFKEKNANVNRKYARIRSEKMPVYSARKVAYSPLQNSHYRIVAPPTVKKAGYKAAFKVPANIKYPTLTIG